MKQLAAGAAVIAVAIAGCGGGGSSAGKTDTSPEGVVKTFLTDAAHSQYAAACALLAPPGQKAITDAATSGTGFGSPEMKKALTGCVGAMKVLPAAGTAQQTLGSFSFEHTDKAGNYATVKTTDGNWKLETVQGKWKIDAIDPLYAPSQ